MNIHDFPNYLIFDDGKVFSKKSNKFLKSYKNTYGYLIYGLKKDGKRKQRPVHRLIAEHYIPNPDNLPQVDHINRNKLDNTLSNLRWATSLDNCNNRGKFVNNTSRHIGIVYHKLTNQWGYSKMYHGRKIHKVLKTKTDALCYKYIILLKIKASIF